MLHFAFLAPVELFRLHNRTAGLPALSTCVRAAKTLGAKGQAILKARGDDPATLDIPRLDNVHNYHMQRDICIGRKNTLHTGLFGASFEAEDYVNVDAFCLDRFRKAKAASRANEITVEKLCDLLDHEHLSIVVALQFVRAITDHIPEMAEKGPEVTALYRRHATKLQLPIRKTKVHTFAATSKNEIIYTEFRDGIMDFLEQGGQTRESFKWRKQPIGGDGLTVMKGLDMQKFLKDEGNPFDSTELLLWMTEGWHQNWMDMGSIFTTFYGAELTSDPSTIGHSATKLGRRRPADLNKVDFNEGTQLLFLVLDAHMLECFRYVVKVSQSELTAHSKKNLF
jgi:hypothetical protein